MAFSPSGRSAQETSGWRERKAFEFPDDDRNVKAAKLLQKLAEGVRHISDGSTATRFRVLQDFIFSDGHPYTDGTEDLLHAWSQYRKGIGFQFFPANAEDYLLKLIDIAYSFSNTGPYIVGQKS